MMKKQKFSSTDFGANNLPSTRKELFFDILKHKYKTLLLLGFVLFLFLLPQFISNYIFTNLINRILNDQSLIADGVLNDQGIAAYNSGIVIYGCCHLLTFFIFFVGLSGAIRIIKLLAFNEGILFWDDFWIGIKQNFKQFSILSLILSGSLFLFNITRIIGNPILNGIIYGITFGLIIPFVFIAVVYSSVYSISTIKMLANSFALYIKNFVFLLLVPLFVLIYLTIDLIPLLFIAYLVKAIFIIFAAPILLIGLYLAILNSFDKFINEISHKELLNKGLYKKEINK